MKTVKVENWPIFFLQRLHAMHQAGVKCDTILRFANEPDTVCLKVHGMVLNSCSRFFELLPRNRSGALQVLTLPCGVGYKEMESVVNFLYTGLLEFQDDNALQVYRLCQRLQVDILVKLLAVRFKGAQDMNPDDLTLRSDKVEFKETPRRGDSQIVLETDGDNDNQMDEEECYDDDGVDDVKFSQTMLSFKSDRQINRGHKVVDSITLDHQSRAARRTTLMADPSLMDFDLHRKRPHSKRAKVETGASATMEGIDISEEMVSEVIGRIPKLRDATSGGRNVRIVKKTVGREELIRMQRKRSNDDGKRLATLVLKTIETRRVEPAKTSAVLTAVPEQPNMAASPRYSDWNCNLCQDIGRTHKFKSLPLLTEHYATVHDIDIFVVCKTCGQDAPRRLLSSTASFVTYSSVMPNPGTHIRCFTCHYMVVMTPKENTEEKEEDSETKPIPKPDKAKPLQCKDCKLTFRTAYNLSMHQKARHPRAAAKHSGLGDEVSAEGIPFDQIALKAPDGTIIELARTVDGEPIIISEAELAEQILGEFTYVPEGVATAENGEEQYVYVPVPIHGEAADAVLCLEFPDDAVVEQVDLTAEEFKPPVPAEDFPEPFDEEEPQEIIAEDVKETLEEIVSSEAVPEESKPDLETSSSENLPSAEIPKMDIISEPEELPSDAAEPVECTEVVDGGDSNSVGPVIEGDLTGELKAVVDPPSEAS
ncbi:unnamed protein product [Notodromas monacha]|uniref:Uncharacterized protein n=1 Tax=Notodromas monacha TaxID=399045 RepID=A0A7R9G920_9CRUS|nr:unnamed protein product [Notodromas monacha]CAG0913806.1 unnamed protein product [Notodromas monacha]